LRLGPRERTQLDYLELAAVRDRELPAARDLGVRLAALVAPRRRARDRHPTWGSAPRESARDDHRGALEVAAHRGDLADIHSHLELDPPLRRELRVALRQAALDLEPAADRGRGLDELDQGPARRQREDPPAEAADRRIDQLALDRSDLARRSGVARRTRPVPGIDRQNCRELLLHGHGLSWRELSSEDIIGP
jgi:hypothetical protein